MWERFKGREEEEVEEQTQQRNTTDDFLVPVTIFHSHGLEITMLKNISELSMTPEGSGLIIPEGTIIGRMRFVPFDEGMPISRAHAIRAGLLGLTNYFTFLHEVERGGLPGNIETPKYLVGSTNERMAKFAENVGFTIAEVSPEHHFYSVWGEPDEVREGLKRYMESKSPETLNKIQSRAEKDYPDYWSGDQETVEVIRTAMPNPRFVLGLMERQGEVRERRLAQGRRNLRILRGVAYSVSAVNLGIGALRISEGDYVSGGFSCAIGVGGIAWDQYVTRHKR